MGRALLLNKQSNLFPLKIKTQIISLITDTLPPTAIAGLTLFLNFVFTDLVMACHYAGWTYITLWGC